MTGKILLGAALIGLLYLAALGRLDAVIHAIATGNPKTIGAAVKGAKTK